MQTFEFRELRKAELSKADLVVDDRGFVYKQLKNSIVCYDDTCGAHFTYANSGLVTNSYQTHILNPPGPLRKKKFILHE